MPGILLATAYLALFLLAVHKLRFFDGPGLGKRFLMIVLALKVLAGTGVWWLYTYHYTNRSDADIYKFFDSSAVMYDALWTNPGDFLRMLLGIANDNGYFDITYYKRIDHWYREYESNLYNDAHTMIRFNAFVRIFSFGNYHVHTVFMCFLSLVGSVCLHRAFLPWMQGKERALALAVFLLPGVLFWGSAVIKESLLMFGLGVFLLHVFRAVRGQGHWSSILAIALSTMLLFVLKFYVLACLLPGLLAWAICARWREAPAMIVFASVMLICVVLALNMERILPGYDLLYLFSVKQKDMYGLAAATHAGSVVYVPKLNNDPWSFLSAAPVAFFNAFLGPSLLLKGGALSLPPALENLVLVVALVLAIAFRQRTGMDRAMLLLLISYCVLLLLVIGWTTPVMGALVRYRVPLLPFMAITALLIVDHRRLVARWPKLNLLFT